MLTNNYLNLVRGTIQSVHLTNSTTSSKIVANVTFTSGNTATEVYSTNVADTNPASIATYAMDLLKVLFFSGLLFKYNYPAYSGYLGCVFIGLDTKTEILPTDYTMSDSFYNYMTLTRSGEYILITVNNTSGSSLTFNTVQVGCTFHTANNNTSTADTNYVLLAEYMLPSQTIVAGGSATYRLKIDNA